MSLIRNALSNAFVGAGIEGPQGPAGPEGPAGPAGEPGSGGSVPIGGTTGQILAKISGTDYDTEWTDSAIAALGLKSATTVVSVSAATAPTSGQALIATSGTTATWQTLAAGGTKTFAVFTPRDNQPPASSFATLDTRNSIAILDFDDASTESSIFVSILPEAAVVTSGLIVSLRWMATTATSGNVRWSVAFERCTTDLDSDSFDTATAATAATNGISGIPTTTDITCTTIDSVVAGDLFRVRVQRLGGDGADTMTGDAELIAVEIRGV